MRWGSRVPRWAAESGRAYYGYSVGTAGGVNGDGYADIIVGAYDYKNSRTDEGRASIYYGLASDPGATEASIM